VDEWWQDGELGLVIILWLWMGFCIVQIEQVDRGFIFAEQYYLFKMH
jgi:hypothetical protein